MFKRSLDLRPGLPPVGKSNAGGPQADMAPTWETARSRCRPGLDPRLFHMANVRNHCERAHGRTRKQRPNKPKRLSSSWSAPFKAVSVSKGKPEIASVASESAASAPANAPPNPSARSATKTTGSSPSTISARICGKNDAVRHFRRAQPLVEAPDCRLEPEAGIASALEFD